MSFLEQLEDLRWHLLRSIIAILIAALAAFLAKNFVFDILLFGPKKTDFLTYKLLCEASNFLGFDDSFCISELPFRIQSRTVAGQFQHIWTSITLGFIVAFPYVIFQFWKFISPALYTHEKRTALGFIHFLTFVFYGYFIWLLCGYPLSIRFLGTYTVSAEIFNDFDLNSYTALVRASVLASGLIFELPIFVYFLTKVGLITPKLMRKYRKIALVMVLFLSAVITPPDVASQIIVAIPVLILYELSIFISKRVVRNINNKS